MLTLSVRSVAIHDRFYSNDEATYSVLAAKILAGGTMYVDAIDHKPPGIAWLYAAVYRVTGLYRLRFVRILLIAIVAATGVAVAEISADVTADTSARAAGLLYVLLTATGFAPNTQAANTELILNLPLALAAIAIWKHLHARDATRAWLWAAWAGAATGIGTAFKYQAALAGLAWLAMLAVPRRSTHAVAGVTGLAAGFATVAAVVIAPFAFGRHLDALLFWGWRYNFQYVTSVPLTNQIVRATLATAPIAIGWLPALGLAAFAPHGKMRLAWFWLAAMSAAVCLGGRFFGNYYLMIAPPLAILAGTGVGALSRSRKTLAGVLVVSAAVLAAASSVAARFWDRVTPATTRVDVSYRQAGDWIRTHSQPDDRLFVWGDSAQIYVYADRLMGTRFAFCNYHTGTIWGTGMIPGRESPSTPSLVVPRAWSELLEDMTRAPPALVADAAAGGLHNFEGLDLTQFPQLWRIVETRYRYETTQGGVRIYRLTAP